MLIYKATNKKTRKSYIGLTNGSLELRKKSHLREARNGSRFPFHRALRTYDDDNWEWEILDHCETEQEASDLEIRYIKEYNTFRNGYNGTSGGLRKYSQKRTLDDIEHLVYDNTLDIEYLGKTHPLKGRPKSEEHKKSISHSRKRMYATEVGNCLKNQQSQSMKRFYGTEDGEVLRQRLKKLCGRPRPKAVNQEMREEIFHLYNSGTSVTRLSSDYGVSQASIYRYIKEMSQDLSSD